MRFACRQSRSPRGFPWRRSAHDLQSLRNRQRRRRRSARPPLLLRLSFDEVSIGGASKMSRTMDGLVVTIDGAPLAEHYEVKQFTKRSFEWTYEGTSPQQLALAILFDYTGDPQRAVAL